MENPISIRPGPQIPQMLSPTTSGRRSTESNSPEFEFWMPRNPSFPQPDLLPADQLIVDGILLPLRFLHHPISDDPHPGPSNSDTDKPNPDPQPDPEPGSGPELSVSDSLATTLTTSKRWRDIFKKSDRKISNNGNNHEDKEKSKRKDRKGGGGGNGAGSAELNINIWPFSRSRSAGNGESRPRMAAGSAASRKVSSAPCSRSNSAGESKSRKWPSSPGRGGIHLGRSSPVWQVRRGSLGGRGPDPVVRNAEKKVKKEGTESRRSKIAGAGGGEGKGKVVNVNVPMCIGYRQHLSCRSDDNGAVDGAGRSGGVEAGDGGRGSNLFNLRGLFTKKVH